MDSGFGSFRQTSRGRGFILLGFYTLFKCFIMFRLVSSLERSFDRSQNLGSKYGIFFEIIWIAVTLHRLFWVFELEIVE